VPQSAKELEVRVLHVVATAERRGAEMFAADLIGALRGAGVEQQVAVLRRSGLVLRFPSPVTVLGDGGMRLPGVRVNLATIGALRDLLNRWKPAVIQVHGGEPLKHVVLAAGGSTARVVYRRIGSAPSRITRGPGRVGYGRLMRRASRVVTVADALRREAIETFRIPPERVVTIPNAVDVERLSPARSRAELRAELGIPPDAPVVISIGALTWEKDPETHLEVACVARQRHASLVHLFVGSGPRGRALERIVRERGLGDWVRLLGTRADVADLLGAADVLLLASKVEGLPACLIEAGMAGLPAAAFAVAGVPEIIRDGESGLLAPPDDVVALTDALSRLLDEPDVRERMGAAAKERCARFDIRSVAPRYRSLYEELAK
jgi:glycosyltransferase involved in cell wall biosynthesis